MQLRFTILGLFVGLAVGYIIFSTPIYLTFHTALNDCARHETKGGCLASPKAGCLWLPLSALPSYNNETATTLSPSSSSNNASHQSPSEEQFVCRFPDYQTVDCSRFNNDSVACSNFNEKATCVYRFQDYECVHQAGFDDVETGVFSASTVLGGTLLGPYLMGKYDSRFGNFITLITLSILSFISCILFSIGIENGELGLYASSKILSSIVGFSGAALFPEIMRQNSNLALPTKHFITRLLGMMIGTAGFLSALFLYTDTPRGQFTEHPDFQFRLQMYNVVQWLVSVGYLIFAVSIKNPEFFDGQVCNCCCVEDENEEEMKKKSVEEFKNSAIVDAVSHQSPALEPATVKIEHPDGEKPVKGDTIEIPIDTFKIDEDDNKNEEHTKQEEDNTPSRPEIPPPSSPPSSKFTVSRSSSILKMPNRSPLRVGGNSLHQRNNSSVKICLPSVYSTNSMTYSAVSSGNTISSAEDISSVSPSTCGTASPQVKDQHLNHHHRTTSKDEESIKEMGSKNNNDQTTTTSCFGRVLPRNVSFETTTCKDDTHSNHRLCSNATDTATNNNHSHNHSMECETTEDMAASTINEPITNSDTRRALVAKKHTRFQLPSAAASDVAAPTTTGGASTFAGSSKVSNATSIDLEGGADDDKKKKYYSNDNDRKNKHKKRLEEVRSDQGERDRDVVEEDEEDELEFQKKLQWVAAIAICCIQQFVGLGAVAAYLPIITRDAIHDPLLAQLAFSSAFVVGAYVSVLVISRYFTPIQIFIFFGQFTALAAMALAIGLHPTLLDRETAEKLSLAAVVIFAFCFGAGPSSMYFSSLADSFQIPGTLARGMAFTAGFAVSCQVLLRLVFPVFVRTVSDDPRLGRSIAFFAFCALGTLFVFVVLFVRSHLKKEYTY